MYVFALLSSLLLVFFANIFFSSSLPDFWQLCDSSKDNKDNHLLYSLYEFSVQFRRGSNLTHFNIL